MLGIERAGSLARAAAGQRPEIELPGALRWLTHARAHVSAALAAVRILVPERFEHVPLNIEGFAAALGLPPTDAAVLRGIVPDALGSLPAPLGFVPRRARVQRTARPRQQEPGADAAPGHREARTLTPTNTDPPHELTQP